MVLYYVYRFDFRTQKGTKRSYIGYSGNLERRVDKLGASSADWCKCRALEPPPTLSVLAHNIKTIQVALLIELHFSAKAIRARPKHVRGGPWLTVKNLSVADLGDVRQVAGCQTLVELSRYVETLPESNRLWQHVQNVSFSLNLASASATVPLPNVDVSGPPMVASPTGKAKASPKAKAKANAPPKARAYTPPATIYRFVRKKKVGGKSQDGHGFRTSHRLLRASEARHTSDSRWRREPTSSCLS